MPTDANTGIEWVPIGYEPATQDLLLIPLTTPVHRINLADGAQAEEVTNAG